MIIQLEALNKAKLKPKMIMYLGLKSVTILTRSKSKLDWIAWVFLKIDSNILT